MTIDKVTGLRARFELWIDGECATRRGFQYHYPSVIGREKSAPDWFEHLMPAATPNYPLSWGFSIALRRMLIMGDSFISAALSVNDPNGGPVSAMQMIKLWIPPRGMVEKDDMVSSIDEMSQGYWINTSTPRIAPAVLISYLKPYYE